MTRTCCILISLCLVGGAFGQECRVDLPDGNGDCRINTSDLAEVLANFGQTTTFCADGDFNRDGVVDLSDLAAVLTHFGEICQMQSALVTQGVAPLRVFFSGEHGSVLQPGLHPSGTSNHHEFQYAWDFGDPNSGTWAYGLGNQDRNRAYGVNAAHVYERPGTYRVTMELTTDGNLNQIYEQWIVVQPFAGTTYYVAADGDDANDGLDPNAPLQTWDRAMQVLAGEQVAPLRILFRRGDSFSCVQDNFVGNRNMVRIGAYGASSQAPVIHIAAGARAFWFEYTDDTRDFVIQDLDFLGPGSPTDTGDGFLHCNGRGARDVCVLNCRADDLAQPVLINYGSGSPTTFACDSNTMHSDIWIVSSTFRNSDRWLTWAGGTRLVFQGNLYAGTVVDHTMRLWRADRAIVQNCRLEKPGGIQQTLKVHNNSNGHYCPPTLNTIVSDNEFVGAGGFVITFGNQDEEHIEETDNILFERNLVEFDNQSQRGIMINGRNAMVRNNIFNLGDDSVCFVYAMTSTHRGSRSLDDTATLNAPFPQPYPEGNRFLHNTVVVTEVLQGVAACTADPNAVTAYREVIALDLDGAQSPGETEDYFEITSRNCVGRNNWLVVTPLNVAFVATTIDGGINNDVADNVFSDMPEFEDAAGRNWTPVAGSAAIDAGSALLSGAWFDLSGLIRDGLPDAGASELR